MISIDPWVFLHPATYHGGGIAVFPLAILVVGVALIAFGAWQLYGAAPEPGPDSGEETTDASADR